MKTIISKVWNIVILVVAIIIIFSALLSALEGLGRQDWYKIIISGVIILLVVYGLYSKFWKKKLSKK